MEREEGGRVDKFGHHDIEDVEIEDYSWYYEHQGCKYTSAIPPRVSSSHGPIAHQVPVKLRSERQCLTWQHFALSHFGAKISCSHVI